MSFSISADMHGEFVSNFLVIMLSQVKMLLWEFFIIPRSVLKGFLYFMSLSVNCDACVCKINCQICFFFCGKTHWITVSFLNIETLRASLYRIVFTARVIIFAIECLLLKVSISSLGVGYFVWLRRSFLEGKSCPRAILFCRSRMMITNRANWMLCR